MDSQIGSDIAKLLGNLGKSTGSSSNSAASSDAGTAFKRALAASTQAQAEQTGGKGLPVQSGRSEAPQQPGSESVARSGETLIAAQVPSDQVATAILPGFDLQIVGAPSEQIGVLKFAKEAGLSDEVLAQLFQQDDANSIDLKATSNELAESVARAINEWVTATAEQPVTSDMGASGVGSAASQLDAEKLEVLIAPTLIAMVSDTKAFPDAISRQLAADLEPVVQNWINHLSPAFSEADLSPRALADAIAPTVTRWLSGDAASLQLSQVSAEAVTANIAQSLAPLLATSTVTGSVVGLERTELNVSLPSQLNTSTSTDTGAPHLQRELEAAVAQWVKVAPAADGLAVTDEWIRNAAQRVAPAVTEWAGAAPSQERVTSQLVARIAPELSRALQSLTGQGMTDLRSAPSLATSASAIPQQATLSVLPGAVIAAAGMSGMTDSEVSTIRANALSQPQPISLSIVGPEAENGRATAQGLASALAQVMAPDRRPAAEAGLLAQPATLDRFALRGVNLRPESNEVAKLANNLTAETVKSATVDSVAALRDLVTARSLELARLSSSNDKPVSTLNAQQNPIAGFGLPEGADNATTRLAGQSEASFRQSLAATDRPMAADASRPNQFALGQNTVAREMVSRQLSEALGQRLAANIAAGHYRLTFNVNPKELGAIDVVMEMRDGRLDAQINTGNAATRELLGDSLPRLRDALTQSGINLAQLQVGSESQQGNAQGRQAEGDRATEQAQGEMDLADAATDLVSEDLELGLDLDSVDFWA